MYLCFIILMNYIVCQYVTISPFPISMSLAINFTLSNVNYLIMTVPVCVCSVGRVQLFATPRTGVHKAPLPMEYLRQARILEWVAISFSRGSFRSRDQTRISCVSCICRRILYHCAAWDSNIKHLIFSFCLHSPIFYF